jgi:hypothetical protein
MTLFQQMDFKLLLILAQAAFALQIDAPPEIAEQVLAYSQEIGIKKENAALMVSVAKNANCNAFSLELIDKSSRKAIKQTEHCFASSQNEVLQNAVHEILGHPVKKAESSGLSGSAKTVLM